ncbi:MAG: molybdenum cofactor guanylyltransferase [Alphaproteobacteria bacterium]
MNKNLISVILTGGKSSRMNFQNKSFLKLDNKFFIENIIANLEQKVSKIIINANNDIDKYQYLNLEIVRDKISGYKGPLAGLHSAMYNYQNTKEDLWFAILPTDAPIINSDYIDLFKVQDKIKEMAFISKINGSVEPMFSFWSIKSFSYLDQILNNNDGYKIMKFAEEIGFKYLNVSKKSEAEFFNVNNQEDYEILLDLLKIN